MKKARLLWGFFVLAATCSGQGVPYFSNVFTSANSAPPGSQTTMYTVPFSTVTVCGATPVGNPCANTVVIYANAAMTVTAHNPIITDVHGKFNFWAPAGTYSYSIQSANGTLLGTYYFTLGGSGGGSSISLQHNGAAVANQNVINFDDTLPAAPTGNVNVVFQNDSTGKWSAYVPIGGSSFSLTTSGTIGPATYLSSVLNIPDYTYTLTVPKITALGALTNDTSGSAAKWGGIAGSGVPGVGQVPVATGSGTATWQTLSATGGISGQTTNCVLKANSATTSNASAPICDDGTTTTISHPTQITDGTSNAGIVAIKQGTAASTVANSIGLTAPTSVTAYNMKFPGAQGTGALTNDGAGNLSWTAAGSGVTSIDTQTGAFTFGGSGVSHVGNAYTFSGGGTSNPATCTTNATTDICVTLAPYYASGSGATTTTTSGTFGVGTSGTVTSCSTYLANNGVLITGAGAAGANYIGTVVSCSGTTLTITPATSTSVASGVVVQHDESAAFQAAITALASTGGNIYVPDGVYLVNGPLQDTGGANAIITLPSTIQGTNPSVQYTFSGFRPPVGGMGVTAGAVLKTSLNSGNLIGAYNASGPHGGMTANDLFLKNLSIEDTQTNPGAVMVNASYMATATVDNVYIASAATSAATTTSGAGLLTPVGGNDVRMDFRNLAVVGFYTLARFGEHSHVISAYGADGGANGWQFDSLSTQGNSIAVDYLWCQTCTNLISAGSNATRVNIQVADNEVTGSNLINDPSNLLMGTVNFSTPYSGGGSNTPGSPVINGGANLSLTNLYYPTVSMNASGAGTTGLSFYPAGSHTSDIQITRPAAGNLNIVGNLNSGIGSYYSNLNNGTTAYEFVEANYNNDTTRGFRLTYLNPGTTFGGILAPNSGYLNTASSAAQMIINTEGASPIVFGYNSIEAMRLQTGLCIGCTSDPGSGYLQAGNVKDSALTSGNCVQASTGGLLATTGNPCVQTIASGTSVLGTSAISSGACATAVTTSATGVATTDVIGWGFNADPTSIIGYAPATTGMLTIISYPTANNVNFKVCNNTAASITPGAVTLNWRIAR